MRLKKLAGVVISGLVLSACGGAIVKDVPDKADASKKYIFYLHGIVEESEGANEKYSMAVNAIAAGSATVVSGGRGDTDPLIYAEKLKNQVGMLVAKGVPARNITISGFSKGAIIALAAAASIKNQEINYVLLAGCSADLNEKYGVDPAGAAGRILSIHDSGDDEFESCEGIIKPSDNLHFEETTLDSGKGHKVFRIPKEKFIEQWQVPLIEWAGA